MKLKFSVGLVIFGISIGAFATDVIIPTIETKVDLQGYNCKEASSNICGNALCDIKNDNSVKNFNCTFPDAKYTFTNPFLLIHAMQNGSGTKEKPGYVICKSNNAEYAFSYYLGKTSDGNQTLTLTAFMCGGSPKTT